MVRQILAKAIPPQVLPRVNLSLLKDTASLMDVLTNFSDVRPCVCVPVSAVSHVFVLSQCMRGADVQKLFADCQAVLKAQTVGIDTYLRFRTLLLKIVPSTSAETLKSLAKSTSFDHTSSRVTAFLTEGMTEGALQPFEWTALASRITAVPANLSIAPIVPMFFSATVHGAKHLFLEIHHGWSVKPSAFLQRIEKDCPEHVHRMLLTITDELFDRISPSGYSEVVRVALLISQSYSRLPGFEKVRERWLMFKKMTAGKKKLWNDMKTSCPGFP